MLRTGDALLFSPGALSVTRMGQISSLGSAYMTIRMRSRITKDGGASVFSVSVKDIKSAQHSMPRPGPEMGFSRIRTSPRPTDEEFSRPRKVGHLSSIDFAG
jgi:hypothetical protein